MTRFGKWLRRFFFGEPVLNAVGRNEPCPCGSGQKFKRCCLDAVAAQRREEQNYSSPAPDGSLGGFGSIVNSTLGRANDYRTPK